MLQNTKFYTRANHKKTYSVTNPVMCKYIDTPLSPLSFTRIVLIAFYSFVIENEMFQR